jgi:AraC-like DNA-binding protein
MRLTNTTPTAWRRGDIGRAPGRAGRITRPDRHSGPYAEPRALERVGNRAAPTTLNIEEPARNAATADPALKTSRGLREWNDILGTAFTGCVVDAAERRFFGELWSCRIDEMKLARIRAQPSRLGRWLDGTPRQTSGSLLLHLQASGHSISRQRGRSVTADPGDGVLCDPDHSYTVEFLTPFEMFVVELPVIGVLAREPGFDLERFAGQKVEKRRSQLLLAFLRTAWLQRDCLAEDPDWRDCVSRTSVDLAMRAIIKAGGHDAVGASAELRRAVIEHIRNNLLDSALRTSSIARALNVSPRSVQNVFEGGATTASGFILEQRLARAAERLLSEPGRQSITGLAYDCGFSDSAYFSRCFSRHYGVAPRDYRREGRTTAASRVNSDKR